MTTLYTPSGGQGSAPSAAFLSLFCATGIFAVLPLLNVLPNWMRPISVAPPPSITDVPPPVVEPDPAAPEAPKPLEKPRLAVPPPPIDFHQLLSTLQLGDGGVGLEGDYFGFAAESPDELIRIFDLDEVEQKPRAVVAVAPAYPYGARESGEVVVEFVIDERGKLISLRVHRSTHHVFEQPALDAVRRSQWQPATVDGTPVRARVRLPVRFSR